MLPKTFRLGLVSLSLWLVGSQLLTATAEARPSPAFWRDLEAYAHAQRARYNPDTSKKLREDTTTECVYTQACALRSYPEDTDSFAPSLSYTDGYTSGDYMYSHYTLPSRPTYVSFEEVYYPSPVYPVSYDSYTTD